MKYFKTNEVKKKVKNWRSDVAIFTTPKGHKLTIDGGNKIENTAFKAISQFKKLEQDILQDKDIYLFSLALPMRSTEKDLTYIKFARDVMKSEPTFQVFKPEDFYKEFNCYLYNRCNLKCDN